MLYIHPEKNKNGKFTGNGKDIFGCRRKLESLEKTLIVYTHEKCAQKLKLRIEAGNLELSDCSLYFTF